jgi:hypothetical protein
MFKNPTVYGSNGQKKEYIEEKLRDALERSKAMIEAEATRSIKFGEPFAIPSAKKQPVNIEEEMESETDSSFGGLSEAQKVLTVQALHVTVQNLQRHIGDWIWCTPDDERHYPDNLVAIRKEYKQVVDNCKVIVKILDSIDLPDDEEE